MITGKVYFLFIRVIPSPYPGVIYKYEAVPNSHNCVLLVLVPWVATMKTSTIKLHAWGYLDGIRRLLLMGARSGRSLGKRLEASWGLAGFGRRDGRYWQVRSRTDGCSGRMGGSPDR